MDIILQLSEMEKCANEKIEHCDSKRKLNMIKDEKLTFNNINENMDIILKLSEMEKCANENLEYRNDKRKLHMIKDEKLTFMNIQKINEFKNEIFNNNIIFDDINDDINDDIICTINVLEN